MEVEEFDEEEEWTEPAVKVVQKKKVPVEHVPPQDEVQAPLACLVPCFMTGVTFTVTLTSELPWGEYIH